MHESPRLRRLRSDLAAMERLANESSVLRFRASGKPAQQYVIEFVGRGLARVRGRVSSVEYHEVEIKLGASYPRSMPEIRWLSPIYHPNISEIGMVCLGGYGTHWVPSLNLDELCGMLWDMARFHNYDVRSPYNREAALWVANQTAFSFPTDARPLRDLRAALGRSESPGPRTNIPAEPVGEDAAIAAAQVHAPDIVTDEPGSRAGRYATFVRKFARDLDALTPNRDQVPIEPEGLILLDASDSPRPPQHPHNEEIVFLD